jgi:NTE family protein
MTYGYPTNFSAMTRDWIDRLSLRGEQVTSALLKEHLPELGK